MTFSLKPIPETGRSGSRQGRGRAESRVLNKLPVCSFTPLRLTADARRRVWRVAGVACEVGALTNNELRDQDSSCNQRHCAAATAVGRDLTSPPRRGALPVGPELWQIGLPWAPEC